MRTETLLLQKNFSMNKLIILLLFTFSSQIALSQTSPTPTGVVEGDVPTTVKEKAEMLAYIEKGFKAPEPEMRAMTLQMVTTSKMRLSDAIVEQLLRDPFLEIRQYMSSYPFLSDQQIRTLISTKDPITLHGLVLRNDTSPLHPDVITDLIMANIPLIDHVMVSRKNMKLSPKNIEILLSRKDPGTLLLLAQIYGIGSAQEATVALLKSGSVEDVNDAISRMSEVPESMVNLILSKSPLPVRRHLLMQGRFTPTANQIDIILKEQDPEVKIGLLRRRTIDLPADVVSVNMFDANEDVSFWFRQRKEFHPTPEQIEIGLSNKRILIRMGFSLMEHIVPNAAQVERGLVDPHSGVRGTFAARKNITLSDTQLDRCIVDSEFSVRYSCVQRAEFRMNQKRFETVVQDKNANMLYVFTSKKRQPNLDLSPFVRTLLESTSVATRSARLALAKQTSLVLNEDQIQKGMMDSDDAVRDTFCAIQSRNKRSKN